MSKDLREQISYAILSTVMLFILCCVMYKQLFHLEGWLELSLMYSIAWGSAILIRKSLDVKEKACIAFFVIIITSFICCILFDLPDWRITTLHISMPFTFSLLISS